MKAKPLLLTPVATLLSITAAQAVDYNFGPSVTENFTFLATDQARGIGTGTAAGLGLNDAGWGSVYNRGANRDTTYMHFDLSSIGTGTINGTVNLSWVIDSTYGGAINGGIVGSATNAWTFPGTTGGITTISGANPSGNYSNGQIATAVIDNTTFQGFANNLTAFNGLAITAGAGSTAHFNGPAVLTGNATTGTITIGGATDWSAAVFNSGTTTLSISGTSNVTGGGGAVRAGGTLAVTDSATLGGGSFAGRFANAGTLAFGSSVDQILSGAISGSGSLTKSGAGTLTLSAANSYGGGTSATAGILKAGNNSAFGASGAAISVGSGATLDINGATLQGYTQAIQIAGAGADPSLGALGNSGGGNLNAIRSIALTGNASVGGNGGRWDIGRLDFNTNPSITVDHIDGGGFVLTKVGSNELGLLTGATNLAGFVVAAGRVLPHENTSFGAGLVTVESGATVRPWGGLTMANAFTLNSGSLVQEEGFTDTYNGTVEVNGTSTVHVASGAMNINGAMSGGGALSKTGGAALRLAGNNAQTGTLTVDGGHVRFASTTGNATRGNVELRSPGSFLIMEQANQFGTNSGLHFNSSGGHNEFALYGNNQTIASLSSSNAFAVVQNSHSAFGAAGAGSTLTVNQNIDTTYSGIIRDNTGNDSFTLSLAKSGTGTLEITGGNGYTGGTVINGGRILANNTSGSATGTGNVAVNTGGTFGGTGAISGAVITTSGSFLAPGASIESLTVGSASGSGTLVIEYDGSAGTPTDFLSVIGNLDLTTMTLDSQMLGTPLTAASYVFAEYGSLTGTFAAATLPAGYTLDYQFGGSNQIAFVPVPEPAAAALGVIAGAAFLRRRRYSMRREVGE
jgi:autotransporter-associated beta strand protein